MKYLLFSFLLMMLAGEANCQAIEMDRSIKIGWDGETSFYSNYVNCFSVSASRDAISNLVIKSTQGKLENRDSGIANGLLKISGLKNGRVTISVYRKNGSGLEFLSYKEFAVVHEPLTEFEKAFPKLPNPVIDIDGYGKYKDDCKVPTVPLRIMRQAKKININSPYQITHVVIYIGSPGLYEEPSVWVLSSSNFDEQLLKIMPRLQTGMAVTLDDITIKDSKGKEYRLGLISFRVTED